MRPDPAVLGLLEDEGERVVKPLPRAEPDVLAGAYIDVRLEDVGQRGANPRVRTVGRDHQIVAAVGIGALELGVELEGDAERARAILQNVEQTLPADAAEAMARRARHAATVENGDVVPVDEGAPDGVGTLGIAGCEIGEGFVRQHDAPAKGVVRSIALDDDDLVARCAPFHGDGEVQSGRPSAETCDAHTSLVSCIRPFHDEPFGQRSDRRDQFSRIDRLCQVNLESCSQGLHPILGSRIRRQRRGRYFSHACIRMPPDAVDELEAIHHRHSQIGDEDIGDVGLQAPQRIRRRSGRADPRAGRLQNLGDEVQCICLIIDREDVHVAQIRRCQLSCVCGGSWMNPGKVVSYGMNDHERDCHSERGPLIDAATEHVDRPAVHFDELPGDG